MKPFKLHQGHFGILKYSIFRCSSYGPTFGEGHDIYIADHAASNTDSYSILGETYYLLSDAPGFFPNIKLFLTGTVDFRPDEVEVFYETS